MTDKKEIIEGLEICVNHDWNSAKDCIGCYNRGVEFCIVDLMEDALKLLKPRVLSFDDVSTLTSEETVWVEYHASGILHAGLVDIRDDFYAITFCTIFMKVTERLENYGKT